MKAGDLVAYPSKISRRIAHCSRVEAPYAFDSTRRFRVRRSPTLVPCVSFTATVEPQARPHVRGCRAAASRRGFHFARLASVSGVRAIEAIVVRGDARHESEDSMKPRPLGRVRRSTYASLEVFRSMSHHRFPVPLRQARPRSPARPGRTRSSRPRASAARVAGTTSSPTWTGGGSSFRAAARVTCLLPATTPAIAGRPAASPAYDLDTLEPVGEIANTGAEVIAVYAGTIHGFSGESD